MVLNPSGFSICHINRRTDAPNMGSEIASLLGMERCSMPNAEAMMSLALRKAVSPLVIGAATTPRTARIPPKTPSHPEHTYCTTAGAVKNCTSVFGDSPCNWSLKPITSHLTMAVSWTVSVGECIKSVITNRL